jgi:probable DNA metabolism protein
VSVLAYDGTSAGFWALVGLVLEEGVAPDAVERSPTAGLFGCRNVPPERAALLASRARVRLELADHRAPAELESARRYGRPVDLACLALALAVDRDGPDAFDRHADPDRRAVRKAAEAVRRELHRLEGLLRFQPAGERAWLALCEPDNELVDLLAPRLAPRFGYLSGLPVPFGVLDLGRRALAGRDPAGAVFVEPCASAEAAVLRFYASDRASVAHARNAGPFPAAGAIQGREAIEARDGDEELWRAYFAAASNPDRANPALQRRFMPERYRRHLAEFQLTSVADLASSAFPGTAGEREGAPGRHGT